MGIRRVLGEVGLDNIVGIAESLGTDFREILSFNLQELPFELPPQIQEGIDIANRISGELGLGLKIPSLDELKSQVLTEANELLDEVRGSAEGILDKIEWLL